MDEIESLRKKLAEKDEVLVRVLEERFELVKEIWELKKQKNIPLRDNNVEKFKINYIAKKFNLNEDFVRKVYEAIFNENERRFGP